jgi:hypothetical protein
VDEFGFFIHRPIALEASVRVLGSDEGDCEGECWAIAKPYAADELTRDSLDIVRYGEWVVLRVAEPAVQQGFGFGKGGAPDELWFWSSSPIVATRLSDAIA